MLARVLMMVSAALAAYGCTESNASFCDTATPCDEGLACNAETNRCQAEPDAQQPSDGGLVFDAALAVPDAQISDLRFDIAYIDEWNYNLNELPLEGSMVIINTGVVPFNLMDLELRGIADNHPLATFVFDLRSRDLVIEPGFVHGFLLKSRDALLFDSGLVTEFPFDSAEQSSNLLEMTMFQAPVPGGDIEVEIVIGLGEFEKTLPILVHVLPFPTTWADPIAASRVRFP